MQVQTPVVSSIPAKSERICRYRVACTWDALFFGPFYVLIAVSLFRNELDKHKTLIVFYCGVMITLMSIIFTETFFGDYASDKPWIVMLANAPWIASTVWLLLRVTLLSPKPDTTRYIVFPKKKYKHV